MTNCYKADCCTTDCYNADCYTTDCYKADCYTTDCYKADCYTTATRLITLWLTRRLWLWCMCASNRAANKSPVPTKTCGHLGISIRTPVFTPAVNIYKSPVTGRVTSGISCNHVYVHCQLFALLESRLILTIPLRRQKSEQLRNGRRAYSFANHHILPPHARIIKHTTHTYVQHGPTGQSVACRREGQDC